MSVGAFEVWLEWVKRKCKKCIYDKRSILSCVTHPWPIFPGLWHPQLWLCKQGDYYTGSSQLNARDTSWSWSTENLKLSWNWWPDQNLGHSKQEMLLCLSPILKKLLTRLSLGSSFCWVFPCEVYINHMQGVFLEERIFRQADTCCQPAYCGG